MSRVSSDLENGRACYELAFESINCGFCTSHESLVSQLMQKICLKISSNDAAPLASPEKTFLGRKCVKLMGISFFTRDACILGKIGVVNFSGLKL